MLDTQRNLHVPDIEKNLTSVSKLTTSNDVDVKFNSFGSFVKDKATDKTLLQGKHKEGLYQIEPVQQSKVKLKQHSHQAFVFNLSNKPENVKQMEMWHKRLGHPSFRTLVKVLETCNQKPSINESEFFCDDCQLGKSHLLPFTLSSSHSTQPLELIHTDIRGPFPVVSACGFKYYVLFLDDYSRFTWLFPLKQKSDIA